MPVAAKSSYFKLRREAEQAASAYPALLAEAERVAAIVAAGVHGRRRAGQGETFWQYRDFSASDSALDIDWRRSARSDHYYIRENEWEAANSVWMWRDGAPGMDWKSHKSLPTKKERASVLLMALSSLLMRAGERCGVMGMSARPHTGRFGIERISWKLAVSQGRLADLDTPFAAHSKLLLASDFLMPIEEIRTRLSALRARPADGGLLHIVDPAERKFPYRGRVQLLEPGSKLAQLPFLLGRAEKLRDAYIKKFTAHEKALRDIARRLGFSLITHSTDQPPTQALSALYLALSGQT
ncbi:MAG TPA: DUF58 domain-containing protein [Hellea balneolensis]|uniref:DUF58 domain-containing protein n=1 Tax=Hellea balneolensis TaxID=287478 RepID=A0A7V5NXY3_9PROT|nr:DUF58 domain-containing protein [Hellea balneolensis]